MQIRKASIEGLIFDCKEKNHIVRASLETIPFQIMVILDTVQKDTKSAMPYVSTLGAAYLAALGVGVLKI